MSGLKIIGSACTNNGCVEILKVDDAARIERMVEEKYKGRAVTLLGSRLSESARGAAYIKR
ncbi:hypothetical protein [Pseudoalteromonas xiamenensis]|uniref:Uncharacterized protein n=1 Tax=Pseudoalteromonas xiamenensis TaxID=882626 RepID=A0A975DJX8_9GAMM|nr:hypothetical protein [Pseudoalteromonas xiamenensis]QTH73019.1 hypothetical protein J5O05_17335 [Pseudoalteromonas xiamenensis]